ncbi:hypothetical protein [Planococcus chinensis]|uniref:Uncharacterized protein n=1 Tax=Planococcus chinensis TaxID=272917 RepID=A0ABW4QHR0_9BACL
MTRCGILVNEDFDTYDIVRQDTGALIDEIPLRAASWFIVNEVNRMERKYRIFIVNKYSMFNQLQKGCHPVLYWRPGTHNNLLTHIKETYQEMSNLEHTMELKRQGHRPSGLNFDGRL